MTKLKHGPRYPFRESSYCCQLSKKSKRATSFCEDITNKLIRQKIDSMHLYCIHLARLPARYTLVVLTHSSTQTFQPKKHEKHWKMSIIVYEITRLLWNTEPDEAGKAASASCVGRTRSSSGGVAAPLPQIQFGRSDKK